MMLEHYEKMSTRACPVNKPVSTFKHFAIVSEYEKADKSPTLLQYCSGHNCFKHEKSQSKCSVVKQDI